MCCLFVCLFVCLFMCLYVCIHVYSFVYLFVCCCSSLTPEPPVATTEQGMWRSVTKTFLSNIWKKLTLRSTGLSGSTS